MHTNTQWASFFSFQWSKISDLVKRAVNKINPILFRGESHALGISDCLLVLWMHLCIYIVHRFMVCVLANSNSPRLPCLSDEYPFIQE